MPSVYAVVSDSEGHVIIPTKVKIAYFFCARSRGGKIYPEGFCMPWKKGPGLLALPGGTLEPGEEPIDGARREYMEETGLHLPDDVSWEDHRFSEDYYAVYFTHAHFTDVVAETMKNLLCANMLVAEAIRRKEITTCTQIAQYDPCPRDNELCAGVESEPDKIVYNLKNPTDWQIISTLKDDRRTNWYYEILNYLKTRRDPGA